MRLNRGRRSRFQVGRGSRTSGCIGCLECRAVFRTRHRCDAKRRQSFDQGLFERDAEFFGRCPLACFCALAKVVSVHLPAYPFGAIASSAGAVVCEFAVSRVTGKDGKQHGAPHFRGEIARMKKPVKTGATYKSRTKTPFRFVC